MHPLAFEFLFGALIARIYLSGREGRPLFYLPFGFSLLLGGMFYYQWSGIALDDNAWYRVIFFGLPSAIILLGCVMAERNRHIKPPGWLIALGNASYSIYLSHLLLFDLLFRAFNQFPYTLPGLVTGIVLFGAIGLGVLAYHWIEKPLLRGTRGLMHG